MNDLEVTLGYTFHDRALITAALTHRSYAEEHQVECIAARLAFLGDALLLFLVTDILYHGYPDLEPGEMTLIRSELVSRKNLARWAEELELGKHLFLGRGEEQLGGRDKSSILAESMESVLAAIDLDGGSDAVESLVYAYLEDRIDDLFDRNLGKSAKAVLQEFTQRRYGCYPTYRVIEETGLPHQKNFRVEVLVNEEVLATETGHSKKRAEQAAAREACRVLDL